MLDEAVLERLGEDMGGAEALREVLDAYLSDAKRVGDEMERAERSPDAKAIVAAAHTLKSSSALVGALRLSELCREAEARGRAGDLDGARSMLPALREALQASTSALRAYRERLGG